MLSRPAVILLGAIVLVAGFAHAQDGARPADQNAASVTKTAYDVARRAAELRPSADRLSWQQIPWLTDLAEGLEVAAREKRPVFLWGSDDEPLERC